MSADFSEAVGRTEEARDALSPRLLAHFRASFDGELHDPDPRLAPLMSHWLLAPTAVPNLQTGPDGHPRTGSFLPQVPLPRRMWASGSVTFHDDLIAGDEVHRRTTIRSVERKQGRTGEMWFVSLTHEVSSSRGPALTEEQHLVYRAADAPSAARPAAAIGAEHGRAKVSLDPLRLFRYSALTFNGHRIHYDLPYARDIEGYEGLVVHGPLQATLLAHAAARELGKLRSFAFKGTAPLIAPCRAEIRLRRAEEGLALCLCAEDGGMTMSATAT